MASKSAMTLFALLLFQFLRPKINRFDEEAWKQPMAEMEEAMPEPPEHGWGALLWAVLQQRPFWVAVEVLLLLLGLCLRRRRAAARERAAALRAEAEARRRRMDMEQRRLELKQRYKEIKEICRTMDAIHREMVSLICVKMSRMERSLAVDQGQRRLEEDRARRMDIDLES